MDQNNLNMNTRNILIGEYHLESSRFNHIAGFKSFLESQQPKNMIHYYRQLSNEIGSMIYIQEENVKLYRSSIFWPCHLVPGFNSEAIEQAEIFAETDVHRVYSRLFSFTCPLYKQQQKLFDVFEEQKIIIQRELNVIEHQLFQLVLCKGENEECQFVSSLFEFMQNMNFKFQYDKYVINLKFHTYLIRT